MCLQEDFRPPQVTVRLDCGHEVRVTAESYWVTHNVPAEAQTLDGEPFYLEELCPHCGLDDALRSQLQHVLLHHPETAERPDDFAFAVYAYVDSVLLECPEFLPTLIRETVPRRWMDAYNFMVDNGLGNVTRDRDSNSNNGRGNGDASLGSQGANQAGPDTTSSHHGEASNTAETSDNGDASLGDHEAGPNATQAADGGSKGLDNHEADEAGPDTTSSNNEESPNATQAVVDTGSESLGAHEANESGPNTVSSRYNEALNPPRADNNGPESNGGFDNDRLDDHRSDDDAPVGSLGSSARHD